MFSLQLVRRKSWLAFDDYRWYELRYRYTVETHGIRYFKMEIR